MITAFMCEILINGGWRGVKLFKSPLQAAFGNRNITFALSKMHFIF